MAAPLRITKGDHRNVIICMVCEDAGSPHAGVYKCPKCGKHPLCIVHYDSHLQGCGESEHHNLILLRARLAMCVTESVKDRKTAHLMADNALLEYVYDDDARSLFNRINKRYA